MGREASVRDECALCLRGGSFMNVLISISMSKNVFAVVRSRTFGIGSGILLMATSALSASRRAGSWASVCSAVQLLKEYNRDRLCAFQLIAPLACKYDTYKSWVAVLLLTRLIVVGTVQTYV